MPHSHTQSPLYDALVDAVSEGLSDLRGQPVPVEDIKAKLPLGRGDLFDDAWWHAWDNQVAHFMDLYEQQCMAAVDVSVGGRWVLTTDVDRSPNFLARAGSVGTITQSTADLIALTLDEPLAGAEDWDNAVLFTAHDYPQASSTRGVFLQCARPHVRPSARGGHDE